MVTLRRHRHDYHTRQRSSCICVLATTSSVEAKNLRDVRLRRLYVAIPSFVSARHHGHARLHIAMCVQLAAAQVILTIASSPTAGGGGRRFRCCCAAARDVAAAHCLSRACALSGSLSLSNLLLLLRMAPTHRCLPSHRSSSRYRLVVAPPAYLHLHVVGKERRTGLA